MRARRKKRQKTSGDKREGRRDREETVPGKAVRAEQKGSTVTKVKQKKGLVGQMLASRCELQRAMSKCTFLAANRKVYIDEIIYNWRQCPLSVCTESVDFPLSSPSVQMQSH